MKAVNAEQMAEIDRRAREECGISQAVLMENAGKAVADVILEDIDSTDVSITVLCGKGNNGGDGFVAGRYLFRAGIENIVVYAPSPDMVKKGAAKENYIKAVDEGIHISSIDDRPLRRCDIVIDALFGTGFTGEISGSTAELVTLLNQSRVYSVDIPSGLNATTGIRSKCAFEAVKTITFGLPKNGFYLASGPQMTGEIIVADIGFPQALIDEYIR